MYDTNHTLCTGMINSIVYSAQGSSIINNSLQCYRAYVIFRFHYISVIYKQLSRLPEREGRHIEKFQTNL